MSESHNDTTKIVDKVEWSLSALTKQLGNIKIDVEESLTIGRGTDNDLVLASKKISRQHACLTKKENEFLIKDLGSSNGTKVNGELLIPNTDTELKNGNVVDISGFEFEVIKQITASNLKKEGNENDKNKEKKAILDLDTKNSEEMNIKEPNINNASIESSPVEDLEIEEVTEATKNITPTVDGGVSDNEAQETQISSSEEVADLVDSQTTEIQPKYASAPTSEKKQKNVWMVYVLIAIIIGFTALMTI